jgi:deoxyuridine 5'-triphosphate nucleotidohydrolase
MASAAPMSHYYRLELAPERWPGGVHPYKDIDELSDANAGFDLYTPADFTIGPTASLLPLGVRARLVRVGTDGNETDSHFWIFPRSSIYKTGFFMANSAGIIDKSYRGELKSPLMTCGTEVVARAGERYVQIVAPDMGWIRQVRVVADLPATDRGAGGFGSTGA